MIEFIMERFQQALLKRLSEMEKQNASAGDLITLNRQRDEPRAQGLRMAQAIAVAGHSPTLLSHLASCEAQISTVNERIAAYKPVQVSATLEKMRDFVMNNILELRTLLRQDPQRARAALMKHLKELVLTPQ